jgi:hypothetical protein
MEKTKYLVTSRRQNAVQNHNLPIANEFFENVAKFKYLRMEIRNKNCVHEEIKGRLNSGNARYHSAHSLFVFQSHH